MNKKSSNLSTIKKGSFYKEPSIYKNYEKCRNEKAQMTVTYAFSLVLPVSFETLNLFPAIRIVALYGGNFAYFDCFHN